jgi:hypothetical protein
MEEESTEIKRNNIVPVTDKVQKKDGNASVTITDPKTGYVSKYSMSIRLKRNLDTKVIPDLKEKDKDCFLVIDGPEGAGKSWLALQLGKYVDPSLDLSRVVFNADAFREAVLSAKKGQCVVFDEAFTGLSSRSSLSIINKVLIGLTMQMRQKNLFILIILPSYFMLDKYIALFRAKALIHVFECHGRRGYFRLYNREKKKLLYLIGKNTYSYNTKLIRTKFRGRFYGKFALGDDSVEQLYRKKKEKALSESEQSPMSAGQAKYKEQRDILVWRLRKELGLKYQDMEDYLADWQINLSLSVISRICARFGEKLNENSKSKDKTSKNVEETDPEPTNEGVQEENESIEQELPEIEPNSSDLDDNEELFD